MGSEIPIERQSPVLTWPLLRRSRGDGTALTLSAGDLLMDISDCRPPQADEGATAPWLYAEEMTHRSLSAYTAALSMISAAGPKVTEYHARMVLDQLTRLLYGLARVQKALLPPAPAASPIDVGESLQTLCEALAEFTLEERGICLTLASDVVLLDARQTWRVGLFVFELVMNACRQASPDRAGVIRVELTLEGSDVLCVVSDNTSGLRLDPVPGMGGRVVKALAQDLDGGICCKIGDNGTTIQLRFPVSPQTSI